ncbi:MAG: hypothetical protein V5A62_00905 [Haloarculaceae archaeon]
MLVTPESSSKPARSGAALDPSVTMKPEAFRHHVSILKRDGYVEEADGMLRGAFPMDADVETVDLDGIEADAEVRPARQEDITGVIGVIGAVAVEADHAVAARLAEQVGRDDVLLRHNEEESRVFFVATVEGDAVGWLHVEALKYPRMEHTAELTVGVLEAYRREGHYLLDGEFVDEVGLAVWLDDRDRSGA